MRWDGRAFGQTLATARGQRDLSYRQVAEQIPNVAWGTVRRVEQGLTPNVPINTILALLEWADLDFEQFIVRSN